MTRRNVVLPPQLRGRWRLGKRLGKGGQGEVYELLPESGELEAVVKLLLDGDAYAVERFRREISALSAISHPNVLPIIDHGMDPVPFYVAPKGEALNLYWPSIRASCSVNELFDRSARFVAQLALGLAAVHADGLVHRDIKPENIIVLEGGVPALADFGIVHDPSSERITERPAGNRFARDLASFYDPTLAPSEGDCLCLANLWAWMLASQPQLQHGNYHWRFHRFVDDERCDIPRAVLALCSEPSTCPRDGQAFSDLLGNRFRLSKLVGPNLEPDHAAARAYAMAVAERDTTNVALRSELDVLVFATLPQLRDLVSALRDSHAELVSHSLPARLHVTGLSQPVTHAEALEGVLNAEKGRIPHQVAHLTCGDDSTADFGVALEIHYHDNPHEDRSKFSIRVRFFHEHSPEVDQTQSAYYRVLATGDIEGFETGIVAGRIRDFFRDAKLWRPRTGPRPRGRGAYFG